MKQFILLLIFSLFFLQASVQAKILTGEVEFNAEDARNAVFSTPLNNFNINSITQYYIDSNNNENCGYLLQGITELKDRKLAKFSDGSYGVQYYDNPLFSWYYSSNGRLTGFIKKESENYPCKIVKYKPDGSIIMTGYRVSDKESFLFDKQGKMLGHWLNNICYDNYNNIIMTRSIQE